MITSEARHVDDATFTLTNQRQEHCCHGNRTQQVDLDDLTEHFIRHHLNLPGFPDPSIVH